MQHRIRIADHDLFLVRKPRGIRLQLFLFAIVIVTIRITSRSARISTIEVSRLSCRQEVVVRKTSNSHYVLFRQNRQFATGTGNLWKSTGGKLLQFFFFGNIDRQTMNWFLDKRSIDRLHVHLAHEDAGVAIGVGGRAKCVGTDNDVTEGCAKSQWLEIRTTSGTSLYV